MGEIATGPGWELRLGRWQDVLTEYITDPPYSAATHDRHRHVVGSVITDPPYSAATHAGHNSAQDLNGAIGHHVRKSGGVDRKRPRSAIEYASIDAAEIEAIVGAFSPSSWVCCFCDSQLIQAYKASYASAGLTHFAPVPCVTNGMTVRLAGDGPSSWAVYLMVARTRAARKWGTLPGAYTGLPQGERLIAGSKSLALMRSVVRDYSRAGDLVCDPYAGSGTTLLAAVMEGRRAIGAEMDKGRFDLAVNRLRGGYTTNLFGDTPT